MGTLAGDGDGGGEDAMGEAEVADETTDGERTLRVMNRWLARRRQDLALALLVVAALLVSASTLMVASSAERDRRTARALVAMAAGAAAAAPGDAAAGSVAGMGMGPMVAPIELPRLSPRSVEAAAAPPLPLTTTAGAPKPAPPAAPAPVATASPAPEEARCQVTLGSRPWSEVWIDGARIGFSPVKRHPVGCGPHEAVFTNSELGLERRFLFTARPGVAERHVVDVELEDGADAQAAGAGAGAVGQSCVLSLGSRPWAEVWIDGRRQGVTPLVAHDLPCGRHEIVLRNHDFNVERREAIQVQAGEHLRKVVLLASVDD